MTINQREHPIIKGEDAKKFLERDKNITTTTLKFDPPPKETRPYLTFKYHIANDKSIIPIIKCCPVCGTSADSFEITLSYNDFHVVIDCDICGFSVDINYENPKDWFHKEKGVLV